MIQFASLQGADGKLLIETSGFSSPELNDEQMRVDEVVYGRVMEQAMLQTGDPLLGLHMGEYMNLSAAGIISQITQTSSTVREALQYASEFAMLGCRALPLELIEKDDSYEFRITPDKEWQQQWPIAVDQTVDGIIAFTIRQYHALTFQQFIPLYVSLHIDARHQQEYERVFGCPVRFGQHHNAIYLTKSTLETPISTSDHQLLRTLVAHAERRIGLLQQQNHLSGQVKCLMLNMANRQLPTIEDVAANMHMSTRNLQRKLAEEGVTYQQLADEAKKELSKDLLKDHNLSLQDVAYLAGYADLSSFSRSFKRWTGQTPMEFKKALTKH